MLLANHLRYGYLPVVALNLFVGTKVLAVSCIPRHSTLLASGWKPSSVDPLSSRTERIHSMVSIHSRPLFFMKP